MISDIDIPDKLNNGLKVLGLEQELDETLFFVSEVNNLQNVEVFFHLETAIDFNATAVFIKKQLNGSYKPLAYIYDYTGQIFEENILTNIQKKIWSAGEVPIACIFYETEIKILDCTTRINNDGTPVYLDTIAITAQVHGLYNAIKLKSGLFWNEEIFERKFKFQNSAYDILIGHIRKIIADFSCHFDQVDNSIINKLIIQSILIKYLEERVDSSGNRLFSDKYFKKFGSAKTYTDVLREKGRCVSLFQDLNKDFNGNIFNWDSNEENILKKLDLTSLANALDGDYLVNGQKSFWKYYEFNYIPVELISRLYEEFLAENKHLKGLFFTPSHLAKLLVDEAMPLQQYSSVNLDDYKLIDPACGSGIFLVIAYKRLIQWWRLKRKIANKPLQRPTLADLKNLLSKCVYGVDFEPQAVRLSAFSLCLALCDELSPKQIIEELKFEDLTKKNIIHSDFFQFRNETQFQFDLIIGNPPFKRGSLTKHDKYWEFKNEKIKIPQGQIALKFLADSLVCLKKHGLQCLIIKSSGLLYNSTSTEFKRILFSNLNVIQILDFTALARNKSLWDNEADVAAAAIFIKNEKPDFKKNILHLTFRRTKATKERIIFEIDDYDLHFVNRSEAINNSYVWKNNLLGGGRIKTLIEKFATVDTFEIFLGKNRCVAEEGYIIGNDGELNPEFIYSMPTLPTSAITEFSIDYSQLTPIDNKLKFVKVPSPFTFQAPNIVVWENIGESEIPIFYNKISFSFKHKLIGISSENKDVALLQSIVKSFKRQSSFFRFFIYTTSSQVLINKNTAILKADLMQVPYFHNEEPELSEIDNNIIRDVNDYMQEFLRHGEKSIIVKPIDNNRFFYVLTQYGNEFSKLLNLTYGERKKRFRLSDVFEVNGCSFIATIFKYDNKNTNPIFHKDSSLINLEALLEHNISSNLTSQRIIRLYQKDTIIIIKPNQHRYWLSLFAYRDADKCFSDMSKIGY